METMFAEQWNNLASIPTWNSNYVTVDRMEQLTLRVDIVRYETKDRGPVKGREMLVARMNRR